MNKALIVIDLQDGFDDPSWGPSNPENRCRENCFALVDAFALTGDPVVLVRHDSPKPHSPLAADTPGNRLDAALSLERAALLVTKSVNSAFYGTPDLDDWLQDQGIDTLVICGIQTNMCVETTARMAGNLGYQVFVPIDATRTFDLAGPTIGGETWRLSADELLRASAVSLHGGGFATVTTTANVTAEIESQGSWKTSHSATTDLSAQALWETYTAMLGGEFVLPGGDRFEPDGPLWVGTKVAVTPEGQETVISTITAFEAPLRCADRASFGDVVLDFSHTFEPSGTGTRVVHELVISGPGAARLGPTLGPQISADFPEQLDALIDAARGRHLS